MTVFALNKGIPGAGGWHMTNRTGFPAIAIVPIKRVPIFRRPHRNPSGAQCRSPVRGLPDAPPHV